MTGLDRRTFLRRLGFGTVAAAAATSIYDLERLLWVPGEKTILLPPVPAPVVFAIGDVFTIDGYYAINPRTGARTTLQEWVATSQTGPLTVQFAERRT